MGTGGAQDILEGVLVYVAHLVVHYYAGVDITKGIDEDRLFTSRAWRAQILHIVHLPLHLLVTEKLEIAVRSGFIVNNF